jgi:hypothetical protein
MNPDGRTASTNEVRTRRSTNRWRLTQGVTALAVAFLAACTSDQAGKPTITKPGDRPSAVATLPNEIDLIDGLASTPVTSSTGATALWNQAGNFKVGTGVLNPFLSIQNDPNEEGFNTDASPLPLNDTRSNFTNALPLNHVPVIHLKNGGGAYREFIFDANESNSTPDAQFSIDQWNLWLCNDANAATFSARTDFTGGDGGKCIEIYDLNGKTLLATDANSLGSGGDFDYQILVPDAAFQAAIAAVQVSSACDYNGGDSSPCGAYLILDTKMGFKGGDWTTGATFEEFSTLRRPWVAVTKTATPSFTRKYNWQIAKSVNPTDIYLFDGQSSSATFTINVTPGDPAFTDSNQQLTGTVTISNTSGSTVSILSITDQLSNSLGSVTLDCPNGTGPVSLADKSTYICTYTKTLASTPTGPQSNTATVSIDAGADVDPSTFTGTAQFNFATATPTEVDKNPNVYDNYNGAGETLLGTASTGTFTYTKNYTCNAAAGSYTNVARVDITNPPADPTATATTNVHCLSLTVTKTAVTSNTRTYQWTINKSATPTSWTLFNGDAGTTNYTVTVAPAATPFIDSNNHVSGSITVHNPNSVSVYIQSVSDVISGAGAPAVSPSCGVSFPYTLTAGSDLVCTYAANLPDGTTRTNTATASAKPTPTGTAKNFTGTASVDFSTATLNEVNKTVNVTDSFNGGTASVLGSVTNPATGTFHPTHTFTCNADAGTFPNTATITETGQTASASVTVTCRALTVTKTATTTWRRSWTWGVTKTINPTSTNLTLDLNQQYIVGYTVTYTQNSPTDDLFRASGTVTVTNPAGGGAPAATTTATINSLADVITGPIGATLSCGVTFPTTLAAGSSINCTYTNVTLPDKTTRTNTATATRQEHSFSSTLAPTNTGTIDYSGTASVTFASSPTTAVDQCVNVADTNPGTTVTGGTCANKTFTYNKTLQYATCGNFTVPNTASFTTTAGTAGTGSNTATPLTGSASVTINVTVPCPQGCTLTLGYWKTHNASFKGGAPLDDNWNNLPLKEQTGFFTTWSPSYPLAGPNTATDFTWFNVFWTAPKGNAYYNLSQQYMAAKLNYLNNAGQVASVTAAIAAAEDFFSHAGDTPAGWATLGYKTKSDLIGWAGTLGSYNEGTIGPGHCSEDNTSAQ